MTCCALTSQVISCGVCFTGMLFADFPIIVEDRGNHGHCYSTVHSFPAHGDIQSECHWPVVHMPRQLSCVICMTSDLLL